MNTTTLMTHTEFTYHVRMALTILKKLKEGAEFSEIDEEVLNEDGVEVNSQKYWESSLCRGIIASIGTMTHTKYTYLTRQALVWNNDPEELADYGVVADEDKYTEILTLMTK